MYIPAMVHFANGTNNSDGGFCSSNFKYLFMNFSLTNLDNINLIA